MLFAIPKCTCLPMCSDPTGNTNSNSSCLQDKEKPQETCENTLESLWKNKTIDEFIRVQKIKIYSSFFHNINFP